MLIKTSRIVEISDKTYTKRVTQSLILPLKHEHCNRLYSYMNRKCICIEKDDMCTSCRGRKRIRNEYNIKRNVE